MIRIIILAALIVTIALGGATEAERRVLRGRRLPVATFCLVHGSWHGPWCSERLIPHLEAAGHRTVAVDLRSDEPGSTCSEYAETAVRELANAGDDVIVVGHSFGGLTIPEPVDRSERGNRGDVLRLHPEDDRMTSPTWGARASRERLGVEPIEIPGGHTPQLSRPAELARALIGLG